MVASNAAVHARIGWFCPSKKKGGRQTEKIERKKKEEEEEKLNEILLWDPSNITTVGVLQGEPARLWSPMIRVRSSPDDPLTNMADVASLFVVLLPWT